MTKDGSNARKQAARRLAEAENVPYTEALRRIAPEASPSTGPRVTAPVAALTTDVVLIGHTSPVSWVAFAPDGRTLATGGDVTIRLWDLASRATTTVLTTEDSVMDAALHPDGHTLAVASADRPVSLWSIDTGRITTLPGAVDQIQALAFSPDGRVLACSEQRRLEHVDRFPPLVHTLRLRDLGTGRDTVALTRTEGYGHALAFHPDGHLLACSGDLDGTGRLLNLATGEATVLTGHSAGVHTVAFSPDGRLLATGSCDATVRLWDVVSGQTVTVLNPHAGYVVAVCFSPDGATLASTGLDSTVRLWDIATGENTACLFGHTDIVDAIAFSPDGTTLASGSHDRTVRLWTLPGVG